MKKALISPLEVAGLGSRVAEVCEAEFPVAEPMFWADCPDDLDASSVYYDGAAFVVIPAPAPPTLEELTATYLREIQKHLDAAAQEMGYDGIISACSYAGYPNAFQSEGISFGVWRAAVWQHCYAELAKVKAGARAVPSVDEILAELPQRVEPVDA